MVDRYIHIYIHDVMIFAYIHELMIPAYIHDIVILAYIHGLMELISETIAHGRQVLIVKTIGYRVSILTEMNDNGIDVEHLCLYFLFIV